MLPPRAVGLGQPAVDAADDRSRAAVQEGGRPAVVSYLEPRLGVVLGSVACDPRLESNAVEHPQDVAYARLSLAYDYPGSSSG